jgi:hypothetical protein
LTQIIGNTRAEKKRQCGEEKVERTGEAEKVSQCMISDFLNTTLHRLQCGEGTKSTKERKYI